MTITTTVNSIFVQTLANIISNLAWFILIYWSVKKLVKEVPKWLEQYEQITKQRRAIDNALTRRQI